MKEQMNIYYDGESDYLEVFIAGSSPTYGEEIGNDITLFKGEQTGEIVGIGILNFKKRTSSFNDLKLNLPFKVNLSDLKKAIVV